MLKYRDIPVFGLNAGYKTEIGWDFLPDYIKRLKEKSGLDMDVDFQRDHVWSMAQRTAYIEYILQGGVSGRDVYFNSPSWMREYKQDMVIVDGKQRITTALMFINNEVPAFGFYHREFADELPSHCSVTVHINTLSTRAEVLKWYLLLNSGGTPHTPEEIEKVRKMLAKETK